MAIVTFSGAKTYGGATTSVVREVPIFKNFPAHNGSVKSVNVTTTLRVSTTESFTFTVFLFKTFNYDSSYWKERSSDTGYDYDCFYQYPSNVNHYLKEAGTSAESNMIKDILAFKTFTQSVSTKEYTFTLDLTSFGKNIANWEGDVYMAILPSANDLYWQNSVSSTITIEQGGGVVKYGVNGSYVDCEIWHAVDGEWVQVIPHYGTNGSFVEIGV